MLVLKSYTQYASKFGKYSSAHRTGIDWFSFQSPKKDNVKERSNYHTIVLFSQFWTSSLLHVQLLVPCYYFLTRIQISQEACKVVWYSSLCKNFPVCCDPYSQSLSQSQWSRSRCCSGIILLFLWFNGYWQLNLWFLCLF